MEMTQSTGAEAHAPTARLNGRLETVPIDKIVPYWRNPRRVTQEAVDLLAESIEKYGYQQPIVTDSNHVIIVGHTRYAALRHLGVEQVPILVAEDLTTAQVKEYRLIDNRAAEFSRWDFDLLAEELEAMDQEVARHIFPEVAGDEVLAAEREAGAEPPEAETIDMHVNFVCPSCFHEWVREITREEILMGRIPANADREEPADASA